MRNVSRRELVLVVIAILALITGTILAVELAGDEGNPEAVCANVTVTAGGASSSGSACVNGEGETITSSSSESTTTTPPPTTTTPPDIEEHFKLSPCEPRPNRVVCLHNPAQPWRVPANADFDLVQIVIDENSPGTKDAMFLGNGPVGTDTNVIRRLEIRNEKCDGAKQAGHNLTVEGGFIDTPRLRPPWEPGGLDCHVDAIQATCSKNVTFKNLWIRGFGHSGFFVNCLHANETVGGFDVILDHAHVSWQGPQPWNTDVTIGDSDSSGVTNSTLCYAMQHEIYIPQTPSTGGRPARNPVTEGNTIQNGPADQAEGCDSVSSYRLTK